MVNVVCVNWGTKYPIGYTERLYNMVKRNTTRDFQFYVLTDDVDQYSDYDNITPILIDTDDTGWWCKLLMFKPGVLPDGEYLYLDLDVVIVDNIDCFFDHPSFGITRDFIRPNDGLLQGKEYNSSVLRFDNTRTESIYIYYMNNKEHWLKCQKTIAHFFGDQNIISSYINFYDDYATIFPDEWLWSLKKGPGRGDTVGDRSQWFGRNIPPNGKICVCHGKPSPQEILDNPSEFAGDNFYSKECEEWMKKHYN